MGFARLRLGLSLGLFRSLARRFKYTSALHSRVEHFQGPTTGVDLIVMGEIGEAFANAAQLLVPRAAPDLHIANAHRGEASGRRAQSRRRRLCHVSCRFEAYWLEITARTLESSSKEYDL
jgi:hypothetical protein